MEDLSLKTLLQFYQNSLPEKTRAQVFQAILSDPVYLEVLEGFHLIESELSGPTDLYGFLYTKRNELMTKIFPGQFDPVT